MYDGGASRVPAVPCRGGRGTEGGTAVVLWLFLQLLFLRSYFRYFAEA